MTNLLIQLCSDQQVLPVQRGNTAVDSLALQFRSAGMTGEVRVIDEQSGSIVRRISLDGYPEEGDQFQPFPAA